ncbi:DUF305 domain-containing protein [Spirillospora sp. NPDC047418]
MGCIGSTASTDSPGRRHSGGRLAGPVARCLGFLGDRGEGTNLATRQRTEQHDVSFVAMFLPHHQSAVRMAKVAGERATEEQVRRLAAHIVEVQTRQVGQMESWLKERNAEPMPPPPPVRKLNQQNLQMLREARGVRVDRLFLILMRMHHAQGISEAADELLHGRDSFAINLARTAKEGQVGEVSEMNRLLTPCTGHPRRETGRVGRLNSDRPAVRQVLKLSCRPIIGRRS